MAHSDKISAPLYLRVWGERACFTRPEMKTERVSYDVMTPSAARGVLEAILWKPQIRWIVERIDVLRPIRWDSVRRNEIGARAAPRAILQAAQAGLAAPGIEIEAERQQRAAMILREVDYVIGARIELTPKAEAGDTTAKYFEMFKRRAGRGQCFHRPYLGTREFACAFALAEGPAEEERIPESRDLGWMLFDIDYGAQPRPAFFRATLDGGRLNVPRPDSIEVRR